MLCPRIHALGGPYLPDQKNANTVSHAMLTATITYSSLPCGVFVLNEDRHMGTVVRKNKKVMELFLTVDPRPEGGKTEPGTAGV
jgi:hypothetical protein